MNEQEIISYLKENRKKGVGFAFMPQDVKSWCEKHKNEHIFMCFTDMWNRYKRITFILGFIYALIEDYEPESKFESHWEEFDIDEDGYFEFEGKKYYYREDARFETENRDRFKGFGGWLYTEGGRQIWSMTPRISVRDSDMAWSEPDIKGEHQNGSMTPRSDIAWSEPGIESKPATPAKIRFWGYAE